MEAVLEKRQIPGFTEGIHPQPGPQEAFEASKADIAVTGGAKGGGKSYGLVMEPLRHAHNGEFGAVIFRQTYPQIMKEGGLWDTSLKIYPYTRFDGRSPTPKESSTEWAFPSGARVAFAHMQYDKDRFNFDGAQIPLICFDQLEQFSWKAFSYMFSINRSTCGVKPYMRATCNPDPDHWLRTFLSWWIDDTTGLAIPERSGVVRWFTQIGDDIMWAASRKELIKRLGPDILPLSFTFIPSSIYDNKILLEKDPGYEAKLKALSLVDRERLLYGNWNIRETAGTLCRREWFQVVSAAPRLIRTVRYWDLAATKTKRGQESKASWTVGLKMGTAQSGEDYISDVVRMQGTPLEVENAVINTASQDGKEVHIWIEQDPGQAGKAQAQAFVRKLAGYVVHVNAVRESKGTRFKPFSAQAEAGNIKLVAGRWVEPYLRELQNFDGSEACVSDQADASSGGHFALHSVKSAGTWGR